MPVIKEYHEIDIELKELTELPIAINFLYFSKYFD